MKISERVQVFVEEAKTKEGKPFKKFRTSFSTKNEDGTYTNKSMEVRFNRENIPEAKTNKMLSTKVYTLEVENGWIGVRSYKNEENEERRVFYLYIDKANVKEAKDIQAASSNDIPF